MKLQALSWQNTPWMKATRPQWRYALRNGIAMCLALTVAYYLNLDQPYWAMTSAAVVSFPTVGGVISKSLGAHRGESVRRHRGVNYRGAYAERSVAIPAEHGGVAGMLYLGLRPFYQ